jgi:protein involved in polysaccharide export with SLBB domain
MCLAVLLAGAASARGQENQADGSAQAKAAAGPPEYLVGPGDTLSIKVFGVPALTQTVRVSNSGKIHVAHIGIVTVDGLSAREIGTLITKQLQGAGLLLEPAVLVEVDQYRAHPVYILGEVNQPGQYVLTGRRWFITDLIGNAEGLGSMAHPIAYLYRLKTSPPGEGGAPSGETGGFATEDVVQIDLLALAQGKAPEMNLELRGGDVLYVRQAVPEHFYVVGDVPQPGVYEYSYGQKEGAGVLRLSMAIAIAGGPARTAKKSEGLLVRAGENGVTEQIRFDLGAVLRGAQPDLAIRANDIIFLPGSNMKTIAYGLTGLLPMLATQAVYATPR